MRKIALLFFLCLPVIYTNAQYPPVKYEMRGIWIAALGIDWPSQSGTSAADEKAQKDQLISIFNSHKLSGMNAMYLHMRPLGDALYKSSIEPWSHYITGKQGIPPSNPDYDPLQFAVAEAHKRGMELHAWLNPYRLLGQSGDPNSFSPEHVAKEHPEWVIKCTSEYRFLNPGLPEVRAYVTGVVMDIVRRYDVDGIHFDDYFYPYTEYGAFNDDATFQKYSYGFTVKAKWRENNVNLLLKMIDDSIKTVKPWVKFTISPSGNPGVNTGIFCNPDNWLDGVYTDSLGVAHNDGPYIDAIIPQLYSVGYGGQLHNWISPSFLNGRHLYAGQAAYQYASAQWPIAEYFNEMIINRTTPAIVGSIYFSSKSVTNNYAGCADSMRYNFYAHPSITPKMEWKNLNSAPNAPANLRFVQNSTTGKYELYWDKPAPTAGGDTAWAYIVYRSETPDINTSDAKNIFGINGETFLPVSDARYTVTKGQYYAVAAFDRNSNESILSNVVTLDPSGKIPDKAALKLPVNGDNQQKTSAVIQWDAAPLAERYVVEVSTDPGLTKDFVRNVYEFRSTAVKVDRIQPGVKYYWRVRAYGQGGPGELSDIWSFESGIPDSAHLISPAHATSGVSLSPTFTWNKNPKATSYKIQIASTQFGATSTIWEESTTTDTFYNLKKPLEKLNWIHYWRVAGINSLGTGPWSKVNGFRTSPTVGVEEDEQQPAEYKLEQNYPNPFNPSTSISYQLKDPGHVNLKVFDILGNEVSTLVNEYQPAGKYTVKFDLSDNAKKMTSGIYIYTLKTVGFNFTRKMLLLK